MALTPHPHFYGLLTHYFYLHDLATLRLLCDLVTFSPSLLFSLTW